MDILPPLRTTALGLLTATVLSACVVAPTAPYPAEPVVIVRQPPPPAYAEVVPAPPYPGAVWISGYWGWAHNRHEWVPGRYERARPGYRWQPHRWQQRQQGGWGLQGGVWVR